MAARALLLACQYHAWCFLRASCEDYWTEPPQYYEFPEESEVQVRDFKLTERRGSYRLPHEGSSPENFYVLPEFFAQKGDAKMLLEHLKDSADEHLKVDADTVDGAPSFEHKPLVDGVWKDDKFRTLVQPFIEERLLPYIRERYNCPSCVLSSILARRYLADERRNLKTHHDYQIFATAIVSLSELEDYEGGLYLQPDAHVGSRSYLRMALGDVLVHTFRLPHGVRMWKGNRHSVVFWFADSLEPVRVQGKMVTPWLETLAKRNDPIALCEAARVLLRSNDEEERDKATEMLARSSDMGHVKAMTSLARIYISTSDQHDTSASLKEYYLQKGIDLFELAAARGSTDAQRRLAGVFSRNGDKEKSFLWLKRAAEQLDAEAAYQLSEYYMEGIVVKKDRDEAMKWLRRSAEGGNVEAAKKIEDHMEL
eukprot:TRINITY_DN8008_c1_g1_i5.p1 TRINITY_DN8008_c1_g1~~TRINITY_DN8008_c1_g1_i5.p1  ORF type:complete len:425 (+),score=58.86 TRINITY_DN8008_c1_g1_i5:42-1316(+)